MADTDTGPEAGAQGADPAGVARLEQYLQHLNGNVNAIAQQNQLLAQRLEQATAPPPQEPDLPPDFDKSMALEMLRRPRDYSRKLVEAATAQAQQVIDQRLQQEAMRAQQLAAAQSFWQQFYGANPDLQAFHGEIITNFNNTNPNEDWSVRANYARDIVRHKLQQVAGMGAEADPRKLAARQLAAGAPGSSVAPQVGTAAAGGDEYVASIDATEEYLAQRKKQQAERRGDQLRNDREYWEEMKQLRLRRNDRQAARGRAA